MEVWEMLHFDNFTNKMKMFESKNQEKIISRFSFCQRKYTT